MLLIQCIIFSEHPFPELRVWWSQGSDGLWSQFDYIQGGSKLNQDWLLEFYTSHSLSPVKSPAKVPLASHWLWWGHIPSTEAVTIARGWKCKLFFPRAVSEQGWVICQGQGWRVEWFPRASLDQGLRNGCRSQGRWHMYTWILEHGGVKGSLHSFRNSWAHALCQVGNICAGRRDHHAAHNWGCVKAGPPFSR